VFCFQQPDVNQNGRLYSEHVVTNVPDRVASGTGWIENRDAPEFTPSTSRRGNPLSCAAALATVALLEDGLLDAAARVGSYLTERIRCWKAKDRGPALRAPLAQLAFERG
jgi:4-aminobutyrate aminotransferase-like enzyme